MDIISQCNILQCEDTICQRKANLISTNLMYIVGKDLNKLQNYPTFIIIQLWKDTNLELTSSPISSFQSVSENHMQLAVPQGPSSSAVCNRLNSRTGWDMTAFDIECLNKHSPALVVQLEHCLFLALISAAPDIFNFLPVLRIIFIRHFNQRYFNLR
jgi:hypothetical protein